MQIQRSVQLFGDILIKAPHPITVLNPDEWFKIYEINIEIDTVWVRGEHTAWFNLANCERTTKSYLAEEKWLAAKNKEWSEKQC